jgi:hypothetical protein
MAHAAEAASEMTANLHAFSHLPHTRLARGARIVSGARYLHFMLKRTALNRLRFRRGPPLVAIAMKLPSCKRSR